MKIRGILTVLLLLGFTAWGGQLILILNRNLNTPSRIKTQSAADREILLAAFKTKRHKLQQEYNRRELLASGKTAYDRIFNTKDQTIVELIERMAAETLPKSWGCEVRVEEFTHFVLLIYLPHNAGRVEPSQVAFHLIPIVKHCSPYLSDVSVFDDTHRSYLFFDNDTLSHLGTEGSLTDRLAEKVRQQGKSFTRFNSKTIQCTDQEGHLFLPLEITGPSGTETCIALLDTGASVTTITQSVIALTGPENLMSTPRRRFNTANGPMFCPVVNRYVNIGGFRRDIEVAVNQSDEVSLLGVNYFEGLNYVVDSTNSCIYVWEK